MAATDPQAIADQLRDRIRHGTLAPGASLNQVELADDMGVSRIPVREALRSLAGEGLVVLEAGRGARVVEHTRRDIIDLYDLRLRLEPPLAGEIIDNLPPADIRHLHQLAEQMLDDPPPDRWSQLNQRFHASMYAPVSRPHTIRIVRQVMGLVEPYSHRYVHRLRGIDRASREHLTMMRAIADRDPDRLATVIAAHLRGARDALLHALDDNA